MTQGARRSLRVVGLVTASLSLAACGALTPKALEGTISGVVSACPSGRTVAVDVLSDGALVRTETVRAGETFTFHLSPGHYVVLAGGASTRVRLLGGVHAHVAIGAGCAGSTR